MRKDVLESSRIGSQIVGGIAQPAPTGEISGLVEDLQGSLLGLERALGDLCTTLEPIMENLKEGKDGGRPYPATNTEMGHALLRRIQFVDNLRDQVVTMHSRVKL